MYYHIQYIHYSLLVHFSFSDISGPGIVISLLYVLERGSATFPDSRTKKNLCKECHCRAALIFHQQFPFFCCYGAVKTCEFMEF